MSVRCLRRESPSTVNSMGQLPAASISKTASDAVAAAAAGVPSIATTKSVGRLLDPSTRVAPSAKAGHGERRRDGEQCAASPTGAQLDGCARRRRRRRPGGDEELVHALETRAFGRLEAASDQIVEVRRHSSSPSRASASRESALLVRVFTVPSGIPRRSATSLCERPRQ